MPDTDTPNTIANSPVNEESGSMLIEWLNVPLKIFGYSSIQVKIFASIIALNLSFGMFLGFLGSSRALSTYVKN